ncbi:VacB/RNase II family 3'-5' exoribonuclease [bacterium]|nr:VacB/RNase II family 3'-5' exoribonuclease [bacterium]
MNITEKSVYQVLFAFGEEGLTVKEILLALNQRMNKKAQLRKALRKLAEKKLCYKSDNHFYLKDRSGAVDPGFSTKVKGKSSRQKDRKSGRLSDGIFLQKQGRPRVFSLQDGQSYPLNPGEAEHLLHGDRIRFSLRKGKGGQLIAGAVEISKRNITLLKGNLERGTGGQLFFAPLSRSFPRQFKVIGRHPTMDLDSQDVFLEITRYADGRGIPEGRIDESISTETARAGIIAEILMENRIPLHFPKQVLQEGSRFPRAVRLDAGENRRDLRSLAFVTIDGDDARDFDDAIYAETEGENFRLWISIADVAEYVERKTEIDKEAKERGTSTYLPGTAIPMLPPFLSSGLCSLKAGVNRKTLTCEILIDPGGEVLATDIYQSINRISSRLTYRQVDHFFETGSMGRKKVIHKLKGLLLECKRIADILEKKRRRRGAIDFQTADTSFDYDPENRISSIGKRFQTKAMGLIEQFMLEANEAVALFCEQKGIPIMWRNHPPPQPEKSNDLKRLFWNNGLKITRLRESRDFNQALRKCRQSSSAELLEYSVLRTMSLAGYWTRREGHFGLAASHYCHFTSPIRRYPDLIVHRGVKAFLNRRRTPAVSERLAIELSNRERLAAKAERSAVKFRKMIFLADRIGDIMRVTVSGFHWKGVFVELSEPYIEGFVDFRSMMDDTYDYDERKQQVTGRKNGWVIPFGAGLDVLLTGIDKRLFMPEFDWLCWEEASS